MSYSKRKYGIENHVKEILEFCEDKDSLYKREAELVNEHVLADPMNMNLRLGGEGGWDYIHKKGLHKRGAKRMNEVIWQDDEFRKRKSIETSIRSKEYHESGRLKNWKENGCCDGRRISEEAKKKIGEASALHQRGSGNSQFGVKSMYKDRCSKKNSTDRFRHVFRCRVGVYGNS